MSLAPGSRIGLYEILSPLGAGGMGEVYRATDTNLGREVALKLLPDALSADPALLSRMEREARALASLHHPHIATLFAFEEQEARRFLVMELVAGETLAERISRGPLPLREAVDLFRQIAEGLEAAHEKGIVHRDLKPANIKITPEGQAKVLDFGLAKTVVSASPISSVMPTETHEGTTPGMIVGTAAYMSPEQARGAAVDKRTDIWAFGVCLYEGLTGKRAFAGGTVTDVLAAVLEREPDWTALPAAVPTNIRLLLERCLRKDPRQRLRDIGDIRIELTDPLTSSFQPVLAGAPVPSPPLRPVWRQPLPIGLALLSLALAIVLLWLLWRKPGYAGAPQPVSRLSVLLPPGRQLVSEWRAITISPDGQELVFLVQEDRGRPGPLDDMIQLYRRPIDDLEIKPIPGTEMCAEPFFSPDGEWLGFYAPGGLKKVSLRGGAPMAIPGAASWGKGTWMHDNHVVYTTTRDLFRLPLDGGQAEKLLTWSQLQKGELFIESPSAVRGTSLFLVTLLGYDPTRSSIAVWSNGVLARIQTGGLMPRYLPTGHLLYLRMTQPGGKRYDAYAIPFDHGQMKVTGKEVPVLEDIRFGQLEVSVTGTLAYNSRGEDSTTVQLVWLDRTGSTEPIADKQVELRYLSPRISPDGTRLLYSQGRANVDIRMFVRDLATGTTHAVGGMNTWWAAWTPDSRRVVYIKMNPESTAGNLFWQSADGIGPEERLTKGDRHQQPLFVTPDGNALVFNEQSPDNEYDLWQLSLHGDRTPRPLRQTKANEHLAALTRDGRYMAYVSDETGRDEIWMCAFPVCEGGQQVSTNGGTAPLWAPDGRTLFYRDEGATRLFAVPVT